VRWPSHGSSTDIVEFSLQRKKSSSACFLKDTEKSGLGIVVHAYNPSYMGSRIGGSQLEACPGKS
jgi:hypothetical protein